MVPQEQVLYRLTIIEEEQVPLSAVPGASGDATAVVWSAVIALLLLGIIYLFKCRSYQKRIAELDTNGIKYHGWKLSRLRETVDELEAEKIEKNFLENVSLFA